MSSENTSGVATGDPKYTISSRLDRPDLNSLHEAVGSSGWPEFMRHDPVAIANWDKITSYLQPINLPWWSGIRSPQSSIWCPSGSTLI